MAWRVARTERGAAAVEAAIVLSIVVIPLMCGIIAYGVMLAFRAGLSQAASEGARAAVGGPISPTCDPGDPTDPSIDFSSCPAQQAALDAVNAQLGNDGYSCTSTGMACYIKIVSDGSDDCASGHSCAVVTLTYQYASHPRVWMPFMTDLLPSQLSFTSVVQVS